MARCKANSEATLGKYTGGGAGGLASESLYIKGYKVRIRKILGTKKRKSAATKMKHCVQKLLDEEIKRLYYQLNLPTGVEGFSKIAILKEQNFD
ncbi:hypothetical protein LWI28_015698 [Acer negundo]|uniref:Uncharacterized protein n=1 Tax=Acer negundo TaxID=4023 RepID=A0AAD5J5M6_ACENE|nr:hypothetical protein LWI28_015698 [Acer negundo]